MISGRSATGAALTALLLLSGCGRGGDDPKAPPTRTAGVINQAKLGAGAGPDGYDPALVKLQVLLDRARFSPGAIDGRDGPNFRRALAAYRAANELPGQGGPDKAVWTRLTMADPRPVVRRYVIDADDVAGPFSPHPPQDPAAMAAADQLGWATPVEELAEAFHMDEGLLKALNPRARFRPGDTILVVERGGDDLGEDVTRIEVDGKAGLVRAYGAGDRLLAAYPATVGGKLGPPEGTLTVEAISPQPAWDFQSQRPTLSSADSRRSVEIAPGPNNPVGAVWIELSDHRCGLHGSPDPANVGEPGGAGCVRLTNWDARELARGAMPGAVVSFR